MNNTYCPCGYRYVCSVETIDRMVAAGELVFNHEAEQLTLGSGAHRARPTLLQQPGYVRLRERLAASLHAKEDQ